MKNTKPVLIVPLLLAALFTSACARPGSDTSGTPEPEQTAPASEASFDSSCGVGPACPVFASSETVVGKNRFLVGLINDDDAPIASPEIDMHIDFYDLSGDTSKPVASDDPEFIYTIPKVVGLYVSHVEFDRPGPWGAAITVTGPGLEETTVRSSFEVAAEGTTPALGAEVPASDTPTGSSPAELKKISTDPDPDPDFYELSVADALERGEPFVLTFSTPKYCASQTCGPTLDIVKEVAEANPRFTYIHAEPYEGLEPQYDPPNTTKAVQEWGLPSEPWVFVVDEDGKLRAKFEGAVSAEELSAALKSL